MNLAEELREHYVRAFPADAARVVEQHALPPDELAQLSDDGLSRLLEYVDPGRLKPIFTTLDTERRARVLQRADVRTALLILRSLDEEELASTLDSLPKSLQSEFRELLEFPEHTAGRFMDKLRARYRADQTVGEALAELRRSRAQRVRSLYVVTEEDVLVGRVDLQDMALAEPDTLMAEILNSVDAVANLTSTEEDLVELFDQSKVDSIPVVDHDLKLLGIIRYANLFQAAEEAATAGIQRMVGASADERALSPPLFAVKRRLVWLHINLLTAFLAAAVVGLFEATIAQFTALAILLPVVAGQSGNAGSQALAVTMRGLALKEINTLHWRQVLTKEVQIGLINGSALALTCGLGVWAWSQSFGLAVVIAIAMITAMVMAGISGALVPMVLSRLGQDPATASSIILTTVTDVSGFLAFLGTATLLASII
ncbi:CBS domain-containing protein [Seongchinamella sediminis]|uniref:CBS domain-containing protein n=1 Tax=Seongchinamella sediminis TaxID=2283635 RepID=A0A3L7DWW6_9GAMM|nr:magnesium transporter [Seongchinamella sediminis]RLQ22068.1 CBS domain-containing protein [Seongchinamella sediminis]